MIADMHTHSEHSHDSACKIEDMLNAQIKRGTKIFAVTDHYDTFSYCDYDILTPIATAIEEARALNEKYPSVTVLAGAEISEGFWIPSEAEKLYSLPLDLIIGSVHATVFKGCKDPYSRVDFSSFTDGEIAQFFDEYLDDVIRLLDTTDFDILAHLTCPLRYIIGKYNRLVDMARYEEKIAKILTRVISEGKSLEVNTSSVHILGDTMPRMDIIKKYRSLGGKMITLGSDAHTDANASLGFYKVKEELIAAGFDSAYYYKNRTPYEYKF